MQLVAFSIGSNQTHDDGNIEADFVDTDRLSRARYHSCGFPSKTFFSFGDPRDAPYTVFHYFHSKPAGYLFRSIYK